MDYYILDDDVNIVKMLSKIVESSFSRNIVGSNTNPNKAVYEIKGLKPDIVLIDYLMPKLDGSELIKSINISSIQYVMISQVVDKGMIGEAYKSGISFFISKPINKIEIESVLERVESEILNEKKLKKIMTVLDFTELKIINDISITEKIDLNLRDLGLLGEKATRDILYISDIKFKNIHLSYSEIIDKYSIEKDETPKIIKQRIRRTVQKGLSNIASLGIEDYMNDIFLKYSNSVYNFQSVKHEMDYIRGNQRTKGKCNIYNFLDSLIHINKIN